jgi:hypothetical protein
MVSASPILVRNARLSYKSHSPPGRLMPSHRRFAVFTVLVSIACESPAAPAARELWIPEYRTDVGVVRTKTNVVFDTDASAENTCNGDVQGPEFTFEDTVQVNNELVSEGSEPNLILHFTQVVSIVDNEVTVTNPKYSLECRG